MSAPSPNVAVPHDGTDAEARPVFATEPRILGLPASAWPRILAPIVIGVLALGLWARPWSPTGGRSPARC